MKGIYDERIHLVLGFWLIIRMSRAATSKQTAPAWSTVHSFTQYLTGHSLCHNVLLYTTGQIIFEVTVTLHDTPPSASTSTVHFHNQSELFVRDSAGYNNFSGVKSGEKLYFSGNEHGWTLY
jgi:hypothetical protein